MKPINTFWEFSDGIRVGPNIFFLAKYCLYKSGKLIIPMYMATPQKIFFDGIFLFSYDEKNGILTNITNLKTAASTVKGNIKSTGLVREGNKIILSYQAVLDDTSKPFTDIIIYDLSSGIITRIPEPEKSKEMTKYFSSYRSPSVSNPGIIASSEVYSKTGLIPFGAWKLPSPLEYDKKKISGLIRSFIEGNGDRYYHSALLNKLISELPADKLASIIIKMKARIKKLESIKKTYYRAYYEEWSCKLRMEAQRKNIAIGNEEGQTPLMSAAYLNSVETVNKLIADGADINTKDIEGRTALMYAIFGNADGTLKLLFEKGAKTDLTTNSSGWRAWMFANSTPLRGLYLKLDEKYK